MGKEEEIEKEKKLWESDEAWELRKEFMMAHYDDYEKIQLQCLSQLFINVTLLGCEYSDSLMKKIREMGAGISAKQDSKKSGNFVKASAARKRQAVKTEDLEKGAIGETEEKKSKMAVNNTDDYNNKLEALKAALKLTPHHLSGEQMIKSATSGCFMKFYLKQNASTITIYIDQNVVLKHTFSQYSCDIQDSAINALIESLLVCTPTLINQEICFDGKSPEDCYANSIRRRIEKVRSTIEAQPNVKGLSRALEAVNTSLIQNTKKLEGWSQQLDLVAGDVLLASRVLSSNECTKPAMATIADQMVMAISSQISSSVEIINNPQSHSSLSLVYNV